MMRRPTKNKMPGWPVDQDKRLINVALAAEHVAHLDSRAEYEGCTRAAYLRGLIVRDIERQGPGRRKAG